MPRSPRIEFAGARYHVMSRGNRREFLLEGDENKKLFMDTFEEACAWCAWVVQAYHPETGELLWSIQVYTTTYHKDVEQDVQDVFIKTLSIDRDHNLLIISDEKSRVFVLNLATKKVTQIE